MNSTQLTGRLTNNANMRTTQDGTNVARFTLAVQGYKDNADFISCVAYGATADWVEKWTSKGTKVELNGRLHSGSYDKDGSKVYYTEVIAERMSFGESKAEAESRGNAAGGSRPQQQEQTDSNGFMQIPDGIDEELPFN